MEFIDMVKKQAADDLKKELGIEGTPNVHEIINYLEGKAVVHPIGKGSTECHVNKEALRLAVVYLRDVYEDLI